MADRNLRIRMLLEAGDRFTKPLRDLTNGASRSAAGLKETRDRLKALNAQAADISAFRTLGGELRETRQRMTEARARVLELARAVDAADAPTKRMTADLGRAREALSRLSSAEAEQVDRLRDVRARMRDAGIETGDIAAHQRRLANDIGGANDALQEQARRLRETDDRARRLSTGRASFDRMQGRATGLAAGGAASIGTGMALGAPILGAISQAMEYESVMTDIAQKAEMSRVAARAMGRELLKAARDANQLPESMWAGMDTLQGFGLSARDAKAMMTPIGRASTAYKAEVADMAAATFAVKDNLKVAVGDTARVIDIMAAAGKAGAFEMKDMAAYFPQLTAGYQGLGQTGVAAAGDIAAALQIVRKGAGDSGTAATNLSNILQKISAPATVKAFEKMGVDLPKALRKLYAEGKTPIEAIAELTNKTLKGDLSRLGYLFEDAQVQQGLRPLIQNMEEYRRIRAQAMGSKGVTDKDFAERMQDNSERVKRARVQMQTLAITMGGMLLPIVGSLSEKASNLFDRFSAWAERNPGFARGLAIAAAVMAGLFAVLGGGAIVMAGLLAPFSALAFAAGALGIGLLPVIGIAAGVVAAVAVIAGLAYVVYRNWNAITGFFRNLAANWRTIGGDLVRGLISGITGMLGRLKDTVVGAASSAAQWFKTKLGIRSPSRVFMGFGGHLMTGLAAGIDDGRDEPIRRIDSLSRSIMAAMAIGAAAPAIASPATTIDGAAAAGAGVGSGGGGGAGRSDPGGGRLGGAPAPITINVYAMPGQDARAIADEVRRQLDDARRAEAARNASRFADRPDWED